MNIKFQLKRYIALILVLLLTISGSNIEILAGSYNTQGNLVDITNINMASTDNTTVSGGDNSTHNIIEAVSSNKNRDVADDDKVPYSISDNAEQEISDTDKHINTTAQAGNNTEDNNNKQNADNKESDRAEGKADVDTVTDNKNNDTANDSREDNIITDNASNDSLNPPKNKDGFATEEGDKKATTDEDLLPEDEGIKNHEDISAMSSENSKEVRLIIELDESSLIEEAVSKDVSYEELDESFVEEKKNNIKQEQDELIDILASSDIGIDTSESQHFDTIINAVTASAEISDIDEIEALPEVKNVYISEEYQRPLLHSSHDITGSAYAHNTLKYRGEGTVVAIIDSGLDVSHKALRLDDESKVKLSPTQAEDIIRDAGLRGKYYNAKVPYGYNYYDQNHNLLDSYGSMHGMHTSGIAIANDNSNNIFGVAPNAQVLALKVFSDDVQYPTTFTDIWLKAIDDAISLKADVINMSLGSPAGFVMPDKAYPENTAISKAREAGIVVTIAAGNEATITEGNVYKVKPLEENYDTAVIANPATGEHSLAVASIDNLSRYSYSIKWEDRFKNPMIADADLYKSPDDKRESIIADIIDLKDAKNINLEFMVKNKIAMIEIPKDPIKAKFSETLTKVAALNPTAIILYNNIESTDKLAGKLDILGDASKFCVARIKRSTYDKLIFDTVPNSKVEIVAKMSSVPLDTKKQLSRFSSWGPSPDLSIKPEITAVGGSIYSTAEDNLYKNMSGTSMASPQVAGAAAILKQYIKDKNISTDNSSDFIKLLLMNTAEPIIDPTITDITTPYFVRQQGSGAMNLENALKTKVVVRATGTNDTKADGKLELREISEKKFELTLELENISDTDKSYSIIAEAIYEPVIDGYRTQKSKILSSEQNNESYEISVPAHSKNSISLSLDYSDAIELKKDNFLEGFIKVQDMDGEANLTVPFLGFYGKWNNQKAIDTFAVKEKGSSRRKAQFMVNEDNGVHSSLFITRHKLNLPIIDDTIYFSPVSTYHNDMAVRIAALRNMEELEYSILDADSKEVLRVIGKSKHIRKLNKLSVKNSFNIMPDSLWDCKINGRYVEEGKEYIYRLKAKLNNNGYGGDGIQIYDYSIKADNTQPIVSKASEISVKDISGNMKELTFTAQDTGSGINDIYLQSVKYTGATGSHKKSGKPEYGKYINISFVDTPIKNNKVLPKIVGGKLTIPSELIPQSASESAQIYVYRNGNRNSEVEITTAYLADSPYIHIVAKDYLSHRSYTEIETNIEESYNTINFMNFYNSIRDNKAKIYVDGKELTTHLHESINTKAEVKIKLADESKHLSMLYIKKQRSKNYIIKYDKENKEKATEFNYYYDENDLSYNFKIDPFDSHCEVVLDFSSGAKPKETPIADSKLDLSKINLSLYKTVKLNNTAVNVDASSPIVDTKTGSIRLEFVNSELRDNNISKVILHSANGSKELRKLAYFDLEEGKEGYSVSRYSVNMRIEMKEASSIEIVYKDTANSSSQNGNATDEDKEHIDEPHNNFDEHDTSQNSKPETHKYPVIFIQSPALLDVLSVNNTKNNMATVKGFIGHIKDEDTIESFSFKLVDTNGRQLSSPISLSVGELEKKPIVYKPSGRVLYEGEAYHFSVEVPLKNFVNNIHAEVTTKNGESASIIRRVFFDIYEPELYYELLPRELNSETVKLKIKAKDDSLKLKLYHEDSLIAMEDKRNISLAEGEASIDTELEITLKPGQNEIKLSAKDITNYTHEKIIYVYRTR